MDDRIYTELCSLCSQTETQVYEIKAAKRQMDEAFMGTEADNYSDRLNLISRSMLEVCDKIKDFAKKEAGL